MSGIKKATLVKSLHYRREFLSLEPLDSELLEQAMEEPWDLAVLVEKLARTGSARSQRPRSILRSYLCD